MGTRSIEVEVGSGDVHMSVKDDGAGFNMGEARARYGLDNMRRRAEEMGGTFSMTSEEGEGTVIRVGLPF